MGGAGELVNPADHGFWGNWTYAMCSPVPKSNLPFNFADYVDCEEGVVLAKKNRGSGGVGGGGDDDDEEEEEDENRGGGSSTLTTTRPSTTDAVNGRDTM